MIKYIGSKRVLVPLLVEVFRALTPTGTLVDLFSGTARVGHAAKRAGYQVLANDLNTYAAVLARCYVAADDDRRGEVESALAVLRTLAPTPGYVTRTFCDEARYFQPHNGARIDAMRDWIAAAADDGHVDEDLEAILLTSLMEAADRVDSTTGVQMAFLKSWAPRSHNDLELRVPDLVARAPAGAGEAHRLDALDAAGVLSGHIGYLDPPYNQHKYLGNYHVWETLCRWDHPEAYGVARKRIDCRDRKSPFNSRPRIRAALADVVARLDVEHLVVSFSDEGHLSRDEVVEVLSTRGEVFVVAVGHKRYVGAQIGIHSPAGVRVGEVSHLDNTEFVFVVPGPSVDRRALTARLDEAVTVHGTNNAKGEIPGQG